MSRDPLNGRLGDPASLHKYLYANGDPANGIDPTGREDEAGGYLLLAARELIKVPSVGQLVIEFVGCALAVADTVWIITTKGGELPGPFGIGGLAVACGLYELHSGLYILSLIP